jgi:hypothetical protein
MTLKELKVTLDYKDLKCFLDEFGGQRIYVPQKIIEKHFLVERVGMTTMEKLIYKWGGEIVDVPTSYSFRTEDMRSRVFELKSVGKSNNEIVRQTGLSRRAIQKILAKRDGGDEIQAFSKQSQTKQKTLF